MPLKHYCVKGARIQLLKRGLSIQWRVVVVVPLPICLQVNWQFELKKSFGGVRRKTSAARLSLSLNEA